jgi:hypothetical protein
MPHQPLVIGDDYPFLARNVRSGLDGDPLLSSTASYQLLADDDEVVSEGDLADYDDPGFPAGKSFIGNVPAADTEDCEPGREYRLRTSVLNDGRRTSKTMRLSAVTDEYEE